MVKRPRILFFDLETAGQGGLYADLAFIVMMGYKWLGDKKARCMTVLDYPGKNCQDDSKLLEAAYELFEEADLIVAHFGEYFDKPFVDSRLLAADLKPLPETRLCDTWRILKTKFRLSSNRLKNAAIFLKLPVKKLEKNEGWPTWWLGALRGDKRSIEDMKKYCIIDVEVLEQLFLKIRPWAPTRLIYNMGMGLERQVCAACGSDVQYRGSYSSAKKRFRRFQCTKCGRWDHERKAFQSVV